MNLTIDGKQVKAKEGDSLLDCALRHGITIPHLCTHSSLSPFGGCRMCLVEIEGMRGYPPSCTTPAAEGMVVQTETEALQKLRRNILGLIMLEDPNACLVCGKRDLCEEYRPKAEKAGATTGCHTCNNKDQCEVRVLSGELGLSDLPVPPTYHERPIERSNPFIDRDLNLCILCGRCVRICKHQQGVSVIDFVGRSSRTHIGEAFGRSLAEAGCTFCGSCIDVCPSGSLSDRFAKWYGKPDRVTGTTCLFCGAACAMVAGSSEGHLITTHAADEDKPLCALGRFGVSEFLSGSERLRMPHIRVGEVLREVEWEFALQTTAERLKEHAGPGFAFVCDTTSTLEDRGIFQKFTKEVMQSEHYIEVTPGPDGEVQAVLPEGVKAAILTGDYLEAAQREGLDYLLIQDCYPTAASEGADAVLPAAVFAEIAGSVLDEDGEERPLYQACDAPGQAKPEWWIVCEIAKALEAEGFGYGSVGAISKERGNGRARFKLGRAEAPAPALDASKCRSFFRGHRIADRVRGMRRVLGEEAPCVSEETETVSTPKGAFEIVEKREVAPNTHEIVVAAPEIAKRAEAGQFAIVMADETSERVPYTLSDWDAEKGTVTFVVLEKGQSSRKLVLLEKGDRLSHVVGPLGIPFEVKDYGTVALAGGCYGIGAIYPVAKALKAAGNKIIAISEARSHYLAYHREKLDEVADEFVQTTVDGSMSVKGHAVDVIEKRLEAGEKFDLVVAIGCPFMMMITSRETKRHKVKTLASLNPIMLDGTGMCGACRITVGEDTKFACVDGPFFDAHLVDWDEVRDRREAYSNEEIQSVGRTEPVTLLHDAKKTCDCLS